MCIKYLIEKILDDSIIMIYMGDYFLKLIKIAKIANRRGV